MDARTSSKVGLMVLAGIGLFFLAWRFFAHLNLDSYNLYAVFVNTNGLQAQTPVRMNGVPVGEVERVALDRTTLQPVVTLSIKNDFRDRIPLSAVIRIASGLLITNPQIEIVPPTNVATATPQGFYRPDQRWLDDHVEKVPAVGLAQISPEANEALKQLTLTVTTLTPKLSGTIDQLRGILKRTDATMANFQVASASARDLASDPKIRRTMYAMLDDLQSVSHTARLTAAELTTELRSVVKRNSGKVDELTNGAVDLLQKFADTVDAARGAVTKLAEQVSDPRLQQSLLETLDLAKTTLARFNQIASDIHNLTGNPNVQNDLKTTVATVKDTTQDAQQLIQRLNGIVGGIKTGTRSPRLGIGTPELSIDLLGRTSTPHFRSDLGVRLPIAQRNAIDLGIYDFAERYKLNAQYETDLSGLGAFRYGIYASKLGVGLNWPETGSRFRVDLYDPNIVKLDARGLISINSDFSLWLGAENIFRQPTPVIGVRLNR